MNKFAGICQNKPKSDPVSFDGPIETVAKNKTAEKLTAPKDAAKDGKAKMSLIPMDILMEFLPPAYEEGILKYERESWRRGFKVTEMVDAAQRHLTDFSHKNEDYDPSAEKLGVMKHHLSGTIFSCLSILHTLKYHSEFDDRVNPATGESRMGII